MVPFANHHSDLCFHNGQIYVAVNLAKFNDPKGNADSWIYVYDANSLEETAQHAVKEVFHGAGGIGVRAERFFVVGGLPDGRLLTAAGQCKKEKGCTGSARVAAPHETFGLEFLVQGETK